MSISRSHSSRGNESRRVVVRPRPVSASGDLLAVPGTSLQRVPSGRKSNQLCSMCSVINFDRYLAERMLPKSIGSLREVLRRTYCPFCRLVVRCLGADSRRKTIDLDDELDSKVIVWTSLSWTESVEILGWDGTRSASYSNKYDLRSMDKSRGNTRAYRFLVGLRPPEAFLRRVRNDILSEVRRDCPEPLGSIQYLADKEREQSERMFFGRTIDQQRVDINLIKNWLDRCEHWHRGRCDTDVHAASGLPSTMKFIDVNQRCVVKAASTHEYVALSYVWGEPAMLQESGLTMPKLLRKDIRFDSQGQEFMPLPYRLPRTLEDALQVTAQLGYNYLWNDALCIVQDDDADTKQIHLQAMGAVYSRAVLTIAAASSHHADCGLPGISLPRKFEQRREKVNGLNMATMFPSFSNIEDWDGLVWNTRGWTLQEKLLSKRMLFFTDWQVYFKCSEAIWTEEVHSETARLSNSRQARPTKYGWAADRLPRLIAAEGMPKLLNGLIDSMAFHVAGMDTRDAREELGFLINYVALVRRFSGRHLSHQSDSLFAIEGILRTFDSPLYAGLPQKFFDEALLWHSDATITSAGFRTSTPTWSWTSCCSRQSVDGYLSTVTWHETDMVDTTSSIDRSAVKKLKNLDDTLVYEASVITAVKPVSRMHVIDRGRRQLIRSGSYSNSPKKSIPQGFASRQAYELSFLKPLLRLESYALSLDIEPHSERCHATALSNMRAASVGRGSTSVEPAVAHPLVDRDGNCCGEIVTPCSMALQYGKKGACDLFVVSWGRPLQRMKSHIKSYAPKVEETRSSGETSTTETVTQAFNRWIVANVLLVGYDGGIGHRIGIGKVIITAWHKAKPVKTCVILG